MAAKHDLNKVKEMIQKWLDGDDDLIWFSPRKKSYGATSFIFEEEDVKAQESVAEGMLKLDANYFCEQRFRSGINQVADVYGLKDYRGHNRYIKFYLGKDVTGEFVAAISFHPLDHKMRCESGEELEVTFKGDGPWKS